MSEPEYLSPARVAKLLDVSTDTIIRRCKSGYFSRVLQLGTTKRPRFRIHKDCIAQSERNHFESPAKLKAKEPVKRLANLEKYGFDLRKLTQDAGS